jgi:hypothetical protein
MYTLKQCTVIQGTFELLQRQLADVRIFVEGRINGTDSPHNPCQFWDRGSYMYVCACVRACMQPSEVFISLFCTCGAHAPLKIGACASARVRSKALGWSVCNVTRLALM